MSEGTVRVFALYNIGQTDVNNYGYKCRYMYINENIVI